MSSCGREPFALQVLDDSMTPEFMAEHIIIIDPEAVCQHESFVLAKLGEQFLFRQLLIEPPHFYLKPLNSQYSTIQIDSLNAIQGVITQRAGRRRAERKHYA